MTATVSQILDAFDRLPEPDRREAAAAILRRAADLEHPPLEDDALTLAAEALFLDLDAREAADGRP